MKTKICFRCGIEQELSHFYKHNKMADGHLNKCKTCTKGDSAKREAKIRSTPKGVEAERMRHREKYHRLNYREKQKEWDKNKPWKSLGKYKSLNKKLKGKGLIKKGEVAHHWNYNEEYIEDVFILKLKDHKEIHKHLTLDLDSRIFFYGSIPLTNKLRHYTILLDILGESNLIRDISLPFLNRVN